LVERDSFQCFHRNQPLQVLYGACGGYQNEIQSYQYEKKYTTQPPVHPDYHRGDPGNPGVDPERVQMKRGSVKDLSNMEAGKRRRNL